MLYKVSNIIRDVRIAIDENMSGEQFLSEVDIETLSLEDIIYSKIEEGARIVESTAPIFLLGEGHNFGDSIWRGPKGSGYVNLPDDFMRLIAFRMSDWERTVYEPITVEDKLYKCQSSRYKGIRGNVQKPVCVLVTRPEGRVLEYYSTKSDNAQVTIASYIPYPIISKIDNVIDLSPRCYKAIVYKIAALTISAFGDEQKVTLMNKLSTGALI